MIAPDMIPEAALILVVFSRDQIRMIAPDMILEAALILVVFFMRSNPHDCSGYDPLGSAHSCSISRSGCREWAG
jgi:hypothetical protein